MKLSANDYTKLLLLLKQQSKQLQHLPDNQWENVIFLRSTIVSVIQQEWRLWSQADECWWQTTSSVGNNCNISAVSKGF